MSTSAVTLRVRHGDDGRPVVLLHGHPRTHTTWRRIAPQLAGSLFVACQDLRANDLRTNWEVSVQNYDIRYDDKYGQLAQRLAQPRARGRVLSRARGKARARGRGAGPVLAWCASGRDDPAWRRSPPTRSRTHGLADGRAGDGDPDRERLTESAPRSRRATVEKAPPQTPVGALLRQQSAPASGLRIVAVILRRDVIVFASRRSVELDQQLGGQESLLDKRQDPRRCFASSRLVSLRT